MAGRPTDYREEYNVQVEKLCRILDVNITGMAYFFSTTEEVITYWINNIPSFKLAIENGRSRRPEYLLKRQTKKEKRNKRRREQVATNPQLKLSINISTQMSYHLKNKNGRHVFDLLGYSCKDLMMHLESLFKPGMNWENYGKHWHIDHKIPASWFKYDDIDCDEFKKCWALNNLQPLEAHENIKKNNRYASA